MILPALAISLAAMTAQADSLTTDSAFVFTDIINIPVTSVKDQNKSGTCWCFASTSFFENEIRHATGDSLDLSEMYSVRYCYKDKADRYVRMYGSTSFSPGGSLLDVAWVWDNYGAVPEEVYSGLEYGEDKHVHGELHNAMSAYVKAVTANPNRKITTAWKRALEGILDAYLGPVPETFEYKGKTYTPKTFAASTGISPDNYVAITSFTHHPYYKPFVLEFADNWLWGSYVNLPLEDMKAVVDNALATGHTVLWAADVSEDGFQWKKGVALMPKGKDVADMEGTELSRWVKLSDKERDAQKYEFNAPPVAEIEVTPELRQAMFDSQETTDDHAMEIVGVATDQTGKRYYKVKNSWDTNQVYDGYIYVSEPYFLAKTIDIYVNKNVVPKAIAKKAGIK